MKLVVGLGNPGRRYAATRHNVGFRVVERFAAVRGIALDAECFHGRFGRGRLGDLDVGVLEPLTYMNLSGDAVVAALAALPVGDPADDLLVVLDDVDLPPGRLRIRPGGGGGGHRGLTHVIERLGRSDFARLRFGVGRPPPPLDTADYVLEPFAPDEHRAVEARVAEAADAVALLLREGVRLAMNRYNPDAVTARSPDADGAEERS